MLNISEAHQKYGIPGGSLFNDIFTKHCHAQAYMGYRGYASQRHDYSAFMPRVQIEAFKKGDLPLR